MGIGMTKNKLVKSVAELKECNYSGNPELNSMYQRLLDGRKQFTEILEKNIKAVMQISSLDLKLQHETDKILEISRSVAKAAEVIFGTNTGSPSDKNNSLEELTNTIIKVSEETDEVYRKIETGQGELTAIRDLSDQAIEVSQEMGKDMDDLFEVINHMNDVISGIESISRQTNLLALNASIEAARSGEAGVGFAVVAKSMGDLSSQSATIYGDIEKSVIEVTSSIEKLASLFHKGEE